MCKEDTEKQEQCLDITSRQIERGIRLVSNIQKLSKLEETTLKLESFGVMEILLPTVDSLQNTSYEKKINTSTIFT